MVFLEKFMKCAECKKEIKDIPIKQEPSRSFISPSSVAGDLRNILQKVPSLKEIVKLNDYYENFCSKECAEKTNLKRYIWFAILDRNACDSECFEHIGWKKDRLRRNIRIGKCKITGKTVEVQPLYHGDNSGQPIECYEHFELKKGYLDKLKEFGYKIVPDRVNHCLIVNI